MKLVYPCLCYYNDRVSVEIVANLVAHVQVLMFRVSILVPNCQAEFTSTSGGAGFVNKLPLAPPPLMMTTTSGCSMQNADVKPCYSVGYGSTSSNSSVKDSPDKFPHTPGGKSEFVHSPYYGGSKPPPGSLKQSRTPEDSDSHSRGSSGSGTGTSTGSATKVIPKTEVTGTSSCCSSSAMRGELLVPKTEAASGSNVGVGVGVAGASSCASCTPPPPAPLRQTNFDPSSYLNQDSNSSSVSSMDTLGSRSAIGGGGGGGGGNWRWYGRDKR